MHDAAYSDDQIISVLTSVKSIAVVGISANPARPSNRVSDFLVSKGYTVYGVNPGLAGKTIRGVQVFKSLSDLPEPVDMVDVFRNSSHVAPLAEEVIAMQPKPKVFWTQLDVRDDAAAAKLEDVGLTVIQNRCPAIEIPRLGL